MKFTFNELTELTTPSGGNFFANDIESAYGFCKKLAFGHYENFPVASILLPRNKREHIAAVYAFARIADDIADELEFVDAKIRVQMLDKYESMLLNPTLNNPIFLALNNSINQLELPIEPFKRLLTAFRMDINFSQPNTIEALFFYCNHSANPVGELVLRIFDEFDSEKIVLSDNICTALQLTNFWQDLSRDIENKRFYIPESLLNKYDLTKENLQVPKNSSKLKDCLVELYQLTKDLFILGKNLVPQLNTVLLRVEIALTIEGGMRILSKSEEAGINILTTRPDLKKSDFLKLFLKSFFKYKIF